MKRKIPPEAFDYYVNLGVGRSYQAVATRFEVSKVAVTNVATREGWQKRLLEIEARVRRSGDEKLAESMEQVRDRHLKAARIIQQKAVEALRALKIDTAMEAVRALDLGVKAERILLGEPVERDEDDEKERYVAEMKSLLEVTTVPDRVHGEDPAGQEDSAL